MIRIRRGAEPPELAKERYWRLARLALEWRGSGLDPADVSAVAGFTRTHDAELERGHGVAREVLRGRLRKKCSYCERCVSPTDPLDHYRPRRPCKGDDGTLDHGGYWWLTWSWSNLLLACTEHNGIKGSRFEVDGPRMQPLGSDATNELPRLLDPAAVDPQDHLVFFKGSDGHWTVQGKTPVGASTARVLQLDRPSDRYDLRLRSLADLVEDLREHARLGRAELEELWARKLPIVLDEDAEYRMLARAYLEDQVADLLREHGLELPSLRDDGPADDPESLFPEIPAQEGVGEELSLRILALGDKPPQEDTRAVILELVALRAWTPDELAQVLPQAVATIRGHLRELARRGDIELDGDTIRRKGSPAPGSPGSRSR